MFKKALIVAMSGIFIILMLVACAPAATPIATAPAATVTAIPATETATAIPTATEIPATPTATSEPTATQTVPASADGKIPVGIVLPDSSAQIYSTSQQSFRSYLKELGYSAQILFSQNDPARELSNVQSLIKQGIKVLILCPVDENNSSFTADIADVADIKVIAFDRLIRGTSSVNYYVSFNNLAVGQAQAQYLVDHANGKGIPLYLFAGSSVDNNAFMFFEGAWSVLQPKIADGTFVVANSARADGLKDTAELSRGDQEAIFNQISIDGWDPNNARKLAKSSLKDATIEEKGDVAILAPNDGTARAIIDIFAYDKDIKSLLITGQDADSLSLQYIRGGK